MPTNAGRATTLADALRAGADRDREALRSLCTDDVRAWTPALSASSLDELVEELDRRGDTFTIEGLDVTPLDVGGDYACAEWTLDMTHTAALVLGDRRIDATGTRVAVHGITVAEFHGDRICSLRQYWDELSLLEQLGLVPGDGPEADA